jgi:uncharacterized membrane protein
MIGIVRLIAKAPYLGNRKFTDGLAGDWLKILIILVLALGIVFRFVYLEQKPYWGDESLTSQRIAGYSKEEIQQILLRGEALSVDEVLKYQRPGPDKGLKDTLQFKRCPIYHVLGRTWMQWLSNHVTTPRGVSALMSLLVFGCIYWLCKELFESPLVGWMAIALVAVSPIHIAYAQEAREYSMWTVTILLSSWALLRAMRVKTKLAWGIYTATLILGFYTHLLSVFIAIGHGIYGVAKGGLRLSKIVIAYLLVATTGILLLVGWGILWQGNFNPPTWAGWGGNASEDNPSIKSLVQTWILNFSRPFFDFGDTFSYQNLLLYLLVIALVTYSIYFLWIKTNRKVWLFVITLIVPLPAFLVILDLILGGQASSVPRYLIPTYLGFQIAIAYLLATKMALVSISSCQRNLWKLVTVVLISSGVLSGVVYSQSDTWWIKYSEYYHAEVAKIVNQTERPLVLASWYNMLTLSHSLDQDVALQDIRLQQNIKSVGEGFNDVFIYKTEATLNTFLDTHPNYSLKETHSWKRQITPINTTQTTLWHLIVKNGN